MTTLTHRQVLTHVRRRPAGGHACAGADGRSVSKAAATRGAGEAAHAADVCALFSPASLGTRSPGGETSARCPTCVVLPQMLCASHTAQDVALGTSHVWQVLDGGRCHRTDKAVLSPRPVCPGSREPRAPGSAFKRWVGVCCWHCLQGFLSHVFKETAQFWTWISPDGPAVTLTSLLSALHGDHERPQSADSCVKRIG